MADTFNIFLVSGKLTQVARYNFGTERYLSDLRACGCIGNATGALNLAYHMLARRRLAPMKEPTEAMKRMEARWSEGPVLRASAGPGRVS
jgi:hypothetical protein